MKRVGGDHIAPLIGAISSLEEIRPTASSNIDYEYWERMLSIYDEAIEALEKALELNPEIVQAMCNLANAYLQQGDADNAIQTNEKMLELAPDFSLGYNNLANAYYLKEEFDEHWLAEKLVADLAGQTLTAARVREHVLKETPCYLFKGAMKRLETAAQSAFQVLKAPSGRHRGTFKDEHLDRIVVRFALRLF